MNAPEKFLKGFFPGRLLILNPVYICKAPEKGGISQLFGHGQVWGTVDSLRWTVKFCHLFTGDRFIQIFYAVQLFMKSSFEEMPDISGCVIVWLPTVCPSETMRRIRSGLSENEITYNKKCGRGLMLFQCIEDTWSVPVFVSGIKSEVDFFFIGIFSIVGMILAKIVDRGIPDSVLLPFGNWVPNWWIRIREKQMLPEISARNAIYLPAHPE